MLQIIFSYISAYLLSKLIDRVWLRIVLVLPIALVSSVLITLLTYEVLHMRQDGNSFGYMVYGFVANFALTLIFLLFTRKASKKAQAGEG